jgi:sarcosine oxidase gamma subunit
MNTTIASRISNGVSLKTRYLALVAAGAVAACTLAVAAPWQASSASPVPSRSSGRIHLVRTQPVHTFYLVATDEERIAVLRAAEEQTQSYDATVEYSTRNMTVLVAGSAATDASLYESAQTLLQAGQAFTIVDSTVQRSRP